MTMTRGIPITAAVLGSLYYARTRLPAQYHFGPKGWPFYAIMGIGTLTTVNIMSMGKCRDRVQPLIGELWQKYHIGESSTSYDAIRRRHREEYGFTTPNTTLPTQSTRKFGEMPAPTDRSYPSPHLQVMPVCQICQICPPAPQTRLTPTDHPTCIILLSSLARYRLDMDSASKIYKKWSIKRQHYCRYHILEATLFLGLELEQLLGEFPSDGITGVPDNVLDDFVAHVRMYGTLLGHTVCLQRHHVANFYNENISKCREEVLRMLKKHKQKGEGQQDAEESQEDFQRSQDPTTADDPLYQPSTSSGATEMVEVKPIIADVKVLEACYLEQSDVKPCITDENPTSAVDMMGLLDNPASGMDSLLVDSSLPEEGDLWRMTNCTLCLVRRPAVKMRSACEDRAQHLILLSGLVMAKAIDLDLAYRVYKDSFVWRTYYCRTHFVTAAFHFGEECRKACGQFPVRGFVTAMNVQTELFDRVKQTSEQLDKQVQLQADDLILFYSGCLAGYYEEEGWKVMPTPIDRKHLSRLRKAKGSERLVIIRGILQKELNATLRQRYRELSVAYPKIFTCLICGNRDFESEGRVNSLLPDQNMILICCLVMNYGLPLEWAKIIFQELNVKGKRTCRKHYIQAGSYICDEIETTWGRRCPRDFVEIPSYIRMDLLTRLRNYAEQIDNQGRLNEDHISRFYNDCQVRYRTETGWTIVDLWQRAEREKTRNHGEISSWDAIMSRKRPANDLPPFIPVKGSKQLNKEPNDEHLLVLRRARCGVCGKVQLSKQMRMALANSDIMDVLFCCLVLLDHISVETAIELHITCGHVIRRICHEHFLFVGDFLRSEYRKRQQFEGECTKNSFHCVGKKDELFQRLLEIGKDIGVGIFLNRYGLKRKSLSQFFVDYRSRYRHVNRQNMVFEEEDACEQEIYLCDNTGVQEIPFDANEQVLKSELPDSSEVLPEQPGLFSCTKEESTMVDATDDCRELKVFESSHEPFVASCGAPANSQHYTSEVKPLCEPSVVLGTGPPNLVNIDVTEQKPTLCTEFSAADLIGQGGSCGNDLLPTGEDEEMHCDPEEFEVIYPHTQENDDDGSSVEILDEDYSADSSLSSCQPSTATNSSSRRRRWVGKTATSSRSSGNNTTAGDRSAVSTEIQIIEALYRADPGKSVFDLATELGVSPATVLSYLRSNVLKDAILNESQLQSRLEICSALLLRNRREPFLSRIITYGVKVLYFEYRKRLPYFPLDAARNLEQDLPGRKVLVTVWWSSRGVIYHQVLERYDEMCTGSFSKHIAKVMFRCGLCGNESPQVAPFIKVVELSPSVILLSCLTKHNVIDIASAKKLYSDLRNSPQRICKDHYIQAVKFLGEEVGQIWSDFPTSNFEDVPHRVTNSMIRGLQPYCAELDGDAQLDRDKLVEFYLDCAVKHNNKVLNHLISEDGLRAEANLMQVPLDDYVHEQKPSTSKSRYSGVNNERPAAYESPVFELPEEKPLRSRDLSSMSTPPHQQPVLDLPNPSSNIEASGQMELCVLCERPSPGADVLQTSEAREHNVILLSCLVMSNLIPLDGATRTYHKILCIRKSLCKQHYTQAVQFLKDEVKTLSGSFPENGLEQLSYNVLMGLLKRIQSCGKAIDKNVVLRVDDLVQFYDECGAQQMRDSMPQQVIPQAADCKPATLSSCLDADNAILPGVEQYDRRPHTDVAHPSKQSSAYENTVQLKYHTCAVCGRRRPDVELRITSFSHDQNIILLSCLVMGCAIEVTVARKIYDGIKHKSKYMCIRHYIEAAKFICSEIQRASGSFPKDGFRHVRSDIRFNFLWRVQQCGDLIDKTVELKEECLLRFYNKCDVRYQITQKWRAEEHSQNKTPWMQQLVDERSSENDQEVLRASSNFHDRGHKRLNNPPDFDYNHQKRLRGPSGIPFDSTNDLSDQEISSVGSACDLDCCPTASRGEFAEESRYEEEPSRMSASSYSNEVNLFHSPSADRFRQQDWDSSSSAEAAEFPSVCTRFQGLKEKTDRLLQSNSLSLAGLGQVIAQHECGAEYQELVTTRLRDARVSINAAKALQIAAAQMPESSDSVVRAMLDLVAQQSDVIVGLTSVVDSIMLNVKDLRGELTRASNGMAKPMEKKLPEETHLHYKNLTRQWNIPQMEPFRAMNLNTLMDGWRRSSRARDDDHVSHCVDFYRLYLVNACEPKQIIQNYACRQSGRFAKFEHLQDLPEPIARVLVECCLDGLRLGAAELLMTMDEIRMNPTKYWRDLGPTDTVRAKVLGDRKKARAEWYALCRTALGRAM
ncbi:hypothetical protein Y032_0039g28 [Ancylostoma ceylanicum]|uniref:Uncharacterized protein n=1 Tax=Ancylostoma ceylanicum TaxID=53326 RepID=A0A016UIU8_9BILA|nr:hypothetical protein Y032_0039g28 [Ancylostoma ceylanicum]